LLLDKDSIDAACNLCTRQATNADISEANGSLVRSSTSHGLMTRLHTLAKAMFLHICIVQDTGDSQVIPDD
jgi:hypothetical protein